MISQGVKTFQAGPITEEMKTFFEENGFLALEDFLTPAQCEEAAQAVKELVNNYEVEESNLTIFSTTTHVHRRSQYFRDSADKISFFFEQAAIKDGKLVFDKINAINKIGHALHEKHSLFADITFSDPVQEICKHLGYEDPVVPQSMVICKPPKIGGEVSSHQDETFLYNEPATLMGFWVPLEDATQENGCLWAIPGSHKLPLFSRYKRNEELGEEYFEEITPPTYKDEEFVPIEMKKGTLLVFPGHLVHKSHVNQSDKSRIAYTWHLFDGAKSKWSKENWLQRKEFPKFNKKYMTVYA